MHLCTGECVGAELGVGQELSVADSWVFLPS